MPESLNEDKEPLIIASKISGLSSKIGIGR